MMAGRTALLVIDVRTAMFTDEEPPHCASDLLEVVASLIERARVSAPPVICVRHHDTECRAMKPGHPGFENHADIAPREREAVIDERDGSAFRETPRAA